MWTYENPDIRQTSSMKTVNYYLKYIIRSQINFNRAEAALRETAAFKEFSHSHQRMTPTKYFVSSIKQTNKDENQNLEHDKQMQIATNLKENARYRKCTLNTTSPENNARNGKI
uniref:Uncharacterized protein n=1 Tax=Romanomermis culicivorax TaxID=13658 RepID=A0A915J131_ROMCU